MVIQKICDFCGDPAVCITCCNCNKSHYCSKDHQEQHWDNHKEQCHPFQEECDPERGRYLVATRDLKPGEFLFSESPVALGPLGSCRLLCLGCHEFIKGDEFVRCPGCWWPLCSVGCASSKFHVDECPKLAQDTKHIGQPPCQEETVRYDIILSLRCLLLKFNAADKWSRVQDMASHAQRRVDNKDHSHITTVRYITEVLGDEFDEDDVHHVHDAIVSNCFEWRSPSQVRLRGVYPLLARMNHACLPNVTLFSDREGTMYVRSASTIKCGESLAINYVGTSVPFWERQNYTRDVHYFKCDCIRCEDPTELGLHYSSPKCENCRDQFMEPNTWLGETKWECPLCGSREEESVIRYQADEWLAWFDTKDTFLKSTRYSIKSILDKVKAAFHNQHYVWEKAALVAVRALKEETSVEGIALMRDLWRRLLKLYDVLEPGMTRRRGVTLYELGVSEANLANAEMKAGKLTSYFYRRQLGEALEHLEEASVILAQEPTTSNERRWHTRAVSSVEIVRQSLAQDEAAGQAVAQAHSQERNVKAP